MFGNLGNEALVVTRNDEVFALSSNGAGCVGLCDMHSTLTPKQVEPLCSLRVVGFAYGSGPRVLAFTEAGELYSWDHNGSTNQGLTPAVIQNSLLGRKVVEVACGSHHSLCLTADGDIFSGQNKTPPSRISRDCPNREGMWLRWGRLKRQQIYLFA